jgi:hypothetical protein
MMQDCRTSLDSLIIPILMDRNRSMRMASANVRRLRIGCMAAGSAQWRRDIGPSCD